MNTVTSSARPSIQRGFGLWWIAANAAGYALAFTAWVTFSQPIWPALSGVLGGNITIALCGAMLGVVAGLAQVLVLRRRTGHAGQWVVATMAGFAVGFVVASWVALAVTGAFAPGVNKYVSNSVVYISFGLLAGASVGVARWLVLRRSSAAATRWILVCAIAGVVGFGEATALVQLVYPVPTPVIGAAYGAIAGALTALVEWLWLGRRPEAWAVTSPQFREP